MQVNLKFVKETKNCKYMEEALCQCYLICHYKCVARGEK